MDIQAIVPEIASCLNQFNGGENKLTFWNFFEDIQQREDYMKYEEETIEQTIGNSLYSEGKKELLFATDYDSTHIIHIFYTEVSNHKYYLSVCYFETDPDYVFNYYDRRTFHTMRKKYNTIPSVQDIIEILLHFVIKMFLSGDDIQYDSVDFHRKKSFVRKLAENCNDEDYYEEDPDIEYFSGKEIF